MHAIDFSKSFLTFRIDTEKKPPGTVSHKPPYSLNNARIQIECCCDIQETSGDRSYRYVLGANCKTERVGVSRDIWTEPNADFVPVFSDTHFLNIKTYAQAGIDVELYPPGSGHQTDRQTGRHDDVFDATRIEIAERPARVLESATAIVDATLAGRPLVARTELRADRYTALLEYPVRTMNANERNVIYQVDTGPVLLPASDASPAEMISHFELAFAAFNSPDWIELLVRTPTRLTDQISVYHYSQALRKESRNWIMELI